MRYPLRGIEQLRVATSHGAELAMRVEASYGAAWLAGAVWARVTTVMSSVRLFFIVVNVLLRSRRGSFLVTEREVIYEKGMYRDQTLIVHEYVKGLGRNRYRNAAPLTH